MEFANENNQKGKPRHLRYLRNCETCFFAGAARARERCKPVSKARRRELCTKVSYTCQWEEATSSRTGETTFELDSPLKKEPIGILLFLFILFAS